MIEKHVEDSIVAYCKRNKLLIYKFVSPGTRGVPDRIIFGNGKVLLLEIKRPGGHASPLQNLHIKLLNKQSIPAFVVDNLDDAKRLIQEHIMK